MKSTIKIFAIIVLVLSAVDLCNAVIINPQNDDSNAEIKKRPLSMNISYFNTNDTSRTVRVKLATYTLEKSAKSKRKRKRWTPAKGVIVNLYLNEISKNGMLGSLKSDDEGFCEFKLVNKFYTAKDTTRRFNFKARVLNDPLYIDKEDEIVIYDAKIDFTAYMKDSVRFLKAVVSKFNDSAEFIPYEDADVRFYVKRDFGMLPLSERNLSTDELGEAILDFNVDIPGDSEGNIQIVGQLVDDEDVGLLSSEMVKNWGKPSHYVDVSHERTLWASRVNAPIWLVLTVNIILLGIWFIIFYIVYQIFRIRKLA